MFLCLPTSCFGSFICHCADRRLESSSPHGNHERAAGSERRGFLTYDTGPICNVFFLQLWRRHFAQRPRTPPSKKAYRCQKATFFSFIISLLLFVRHSYSWICEAAFAPPGGTGWTLWSDFLRDAGLPQVSTFARACVCVCVCVCVCSQCVSSQ